MSEQDEFSNLRAQAQSDLDEGRDELLQDLKRKSLDELFDLDPVLLGRLTPKQRADLFRQEPLRQSINRPQARPAPKPKGRVKASALRRAWIALPPMVRCHAMALVVAGVTASVALCLMNQDLALTGLLFGPSTLPEHVELWPRCRRLTAYTDGCLYIVQNALPWSEAAEDLKIKETELRSVNRHLDPGPTLYRDAQLIVWRERIPLQGANHVR